MQQLHRKGCALFKNILHIILIALAYDDDREMTTETAALSRLDIQCRFFICVYKKLVARFTRVHWEMEC